MAGKKKKDKKSTQKENKDQLSAVDQTFFELTISDLNNKLGHLRAHNAKLEQRNEELEAEMAQLNEDRADVTAFLNRSLHTQTCSIKDLEEKLSELSKVRQEENEHYQNLIKSWEVKYKAMNDQLSSEIKLLNGKLNSLEEFRIQKDELMTKFDQQETDLKEQNQRHKVVLFEMERKQIIDKDRLKKEVENKLVQLSNEFRKSNEIRIASHVQRLVRENIALNNELDRMLVTHRRMDSEMQTILKRHNDTRDMSKTMLAENAELAKLCTKYVQTIKELSNECHAFRQQKAQVDQTHGLRQMAETREMTVRRELNDFKAKMLDLERNLDTQRSNCQMHSARAEENDRTIEHLWDALQQVKHAILNAVQFDDSRDDQLVFTEIQRKNVLKELESLLTQIKDIPIPTNVDSLGLAAPAAMKSRESVALYRKGTVGILPKMPTSSLIKFNRPGYRTAVDVVSSTPETQLDVCEVIDVGTGQDGCMSMAESMGSTELLKD